MKEESNFPTGNQSSLVSEISSRRAGYNDASPVKPCPAYKQPKIKDYTSVVERSIDSTQQTGRS